MMSSNGQYSKVAQFLHWFIAALIICQYVLAELAESADHSGRVVQQLALLANHKSIGMTVLMLALIRLVWRLFHRPPDLPMAMSKWQQTASHLTHWVIYALIFLLPVSGWLMSSANAYSVSWFNLFVFPDLVPNEKSLAVFFNNTHELLGDLLLLLVVLHVLAAIKHHFVDKDGVLIRMATIQGWGVFIITIATVLAVWGTFFSGQKNNGQNNVSYLPSDEPVHTTVGQPKSDLPVWNIDYEQSYIRFTADQAGAPFTGEWTQWSANMQFDEKRLVSSLFDVEIDTSQVYSKDDERDGYIVGDDFFDADNFKTARFLANEFIRTGENQYKSEGLLSIKGLSKTVLFTFSVTRDQNNFVLEGASTIDRLSWNVGTGDWADPTWVGHDVRVEVKVFTAQ